MSREADLYKDKIEVSLDGRQIFYLFFGGAVIVGLVFVLGVMVGRRVEARGHVDRARTTTAADPLAALDRLEGTNGLSFKGALMGKESTSDVERQIGELEKARVAHEPVKPAKPDAKPEKLDGKLDGKVDKLEEPKPEVKPEAKPEVKPEAKKPEPKVEAKAEPKPVAKPEAKPEVKPESKHEAKPESQAKVEPKPEVKPEAKPEKKPEAKKSDVVADAFGLEPKPEPSPSPKTEKKTDTTKYTLQLSSFQDKGEAEAFLTLVKDSGYTATITEATVSGKAFYRVRMGTYKSIEAANDAKADVESKLKKSASVMRL